MKIRDIARLAGVSVATVSRVLNHPHLVREETKRRVLEVIERIGYEPDAVARSLRTRKTKNIGIIIPIESGSVFESPYFGLLMKGMTMAAGSKGYHLVFSMCRMEDLSVYKRFFKRSIADGFIVVDVMDGDTRIALLKKEEIPFVVIGRPEGVGEYTYVDSDNEGGAFRATEYLVKTGHRRIALVNGPSRMSVSRHRLEGYRRALEKAGIEVNPDLVVEGRFTERDGYELTKSVLEGGVDAILYSGDVMAFGGMEAMEELGLVPGRDVSVIGFDDVPASKLLGLSSVRQPVEEIGRKAAEILMDIMEGRKVESFVFPTRLVLRRSVRGGGDGDPQEELDDGDSG